MSSLCGVDCGKCQMKEACKGCSETDGRPFGGDCVLAYCCDKKDCLKSAGEYKAKLIKEFNSLEIENMPEVTELYSLAGSFINLEYKLPNGTALKLLEDNNIYLGNQLHKTGSERCYGLAADNNYLLVCEYGENGADPKIVIYKRR